MCVGININLTGLKKRGCWGCGDLAFSYQSAAVGCFLLVTCVAKMELCVFGLFGLFGVAFEAGLFFGPTICVYSRRGYVRVTSPCYWCFGTSE